MEMPISQLLSLITLGVSLFSVNLLFLRGRTHQLYNFLAICLLATSVFMIIKFIRTLSIALHVDAFVFVLPCLLTIAPSLWFYIKGLTASQEWKWHWNKNSYSHFALPAIGLVVAIITLFLDYDTKYALLVDGEESVLDALSTFQRYVFSTLLTAVFVLLMAWVIQSAFYLWWSLRLLKEYRTKLKDVFASTTEKELMWLNSLIMIIGATWLLWAMVLVIDNTIAAVAIPDVLNAVMLLVVVWVLCLWGLRQKPGFADIYSDPVNDVPVKNEPVNHEPAKYQKSALDTDQANRIQVKLQMAMEIDKLYLDASLSLPKLAKHLGISSNYISQTLNEVLSVSFFDFVNQYRVNAAMVLLEQTATPVIDVGFDVGFNAKSSFYSAFKKWTQQTPAQYRKSKTNDL